MKMIKILVSIVAALTVMLGTLSLSAFAYTVNDLDGDGLVTTKDVLLLRKYLAGMTVTIDKEAADSNFDGVINTKDLLIIRKVMANIIPNPQPVNEDVDPTYPTEVNEAKVFVNQTGYQNVSEKISRISATNFKDTYKCYLVDATTNKSVFSADSLSAAPDNVSNLQISKFDFSSYTKSGSYYIATPFGHSYTFKIDAEPYTAVQDAMVTALYYNRCGTALDRNIVAEHYDHGICHNDSSKPVYFLNILDSATGKYGFDKALASTSDKFCGGLHDAGDYGRYTTPANQVVADCIYMSEMFPDGCTTNLITDNAGEKIMDTLDEARYEMKWLLKMQNQANGGVYFRLCTKAFSGWTDTPDKDSYFNGTNALGLYASREMVKPTAGMAGAAAACYTAFKNIDPTFATQCLTAAKYAYEYVEKNIDVAGAKAAFTSASENNIVGAGDYGSSEVYGDYFFAAAALYRATGEAKYDTMAKKIIDEKIAPATGSATVSATAITAYNIGGAGSLAYLLNDKADATYQQKLLANMEASAKSAKKISNSDKFGNVLAQGSYGWGSNAAMTAITKNMANVDYFAGTKTYETTIRRVMNFMLGCNFSGYSFVTGYGSKTPQQPHHRPSMAARYNYKAAPAPGWVVGGISGSAYQDAENNYQTNEVCVYWNTSPAYSMAYVISNDKNA